MEPRKFLNDDDAVSPVIGVILMVAITVILAAVIASFVLGLGDTTQQTPTASFNFDWDGSGTLTITHDGGDTLEGDRLSLAGDVSATPWSSGDVSAGDSVTTSSASAGDSVRVVWTDSSGETSSTLAEYEVPS